MKEEEVTTNTTQLVSKRTKQKQMSLHTYRIQDTAQLHERVLRFLHDKNIHIKKINGNWLDTKKLAKDPVIETRNAKQGGIRKTISGGIGQKYPELDFFVLENGVVFLLFFFFPF